MFSDPILVSPNQLINDISAPSIDICDPLYEIKDYDQLWPLKRLLMAAVEIVAKRGIIKLLKSKWKATGDLYENGK